MRGKKYEPPSHWVKRPVPKMGDGWWYVHNHKVMALQAELLLIGCKYGNTDKIVIPGIRGGVVAIFHIDRRANSHKCKAFLYMPHYTEALLMLEGKQ